MARCSPKRHSVIEESHSCETERSDSLNEGTQRTFLKVIRTMFPSLSLTVTGISPIKVQR
eukprot:1798196-Pleurochrysis_carterae.AAC.2